MGIFKTSSIIALPLAALAIAGCGGGGDDSTSTEATTAATTALSKADLISQGDAICAEVNNAIGAVSVSGAEVPQQIIQVSNLYIGLVDSLKGLGTPEDEAGYAAFIAAADELAKVEGEVKLAAEREDTAALGEAAAAATPALEEFSSIAGDYGFEECSEGPSAPTSAGSESGAAPEEVEEGGVEAAPEEIEEEVVPEEAAPEEAAPETGGAGGGVEEAAPESAPETGGGSGGVGPG
ncbi:MAG TPA: hypothetical protein VEW07_13700 [Solirubrobacterales bacterium]|nr:hypothetical protein [Solirubrobacterales bacterium]